VPDGGRNSIHRVAAGHYTVYVEYGTPGSYRYGRVNSINVPSSTRSVLTLHPVLDGTHPLHGSSAEEYAAAGR
jgi:hypothetical protein